MLSKAKRVFIEHPKLRKHAQPGKGRPMDMQKHREELKQCLLTIQELENMHKQLKEGQ